MVYTNIYAKIELLKVKVLLIYFSTESVSVRRERRYMTQLMSCAKGRERGQGFVFWLCEQIL
jgi:hypothetical protein